MKAISKEVSDSKKKKSLDKIDYNLWNDAFVSESSLFIQLCDAGLYWQSQLFKN